MPKVSGKRIDSKLEKKLLEDFWVFIGETDSNEAQEFFYQFFTPTEVLMFAKRLAILKRLVKNKSYAEIGRELTVTNETVARMSNLLHRSGEDFLSILVKDLD